MVAGVGGAVAGRRRLGPHRVAGLRGAGEASLRLHQCELQLVLWMKRAAHSAAAYAHTRQQGGRGRWQGGGTAEKKESPSSASLSSWARQTVRGIEAIGAPVSTSPFSMMPACSHSTLPQRSPGTAARFSGALGRQWRRRARGRA